MSKLIKKSNRIDLVESGNIENAGQLKPVADAISRRAFLKNSGLMAGGAALATTLSPVMMKKADAAMMPTSGGGVH